MKTTLLTAVLLLVACAPGIARAQASPSAQAKAPSAPAATDSAQAGNGDAFYYFMLGHLAEQDYEAASGADSADTAINSYKKALELSPGSPVILERLAEVYA